MILYKGLVSTGYMLSAQCMQLAFVNCKISFDTTITSISVAARSCSMLVVDVAGPVGYVN